jgi:endonuclease/exonuclease/phosphatase family metal-dependent hydrolase
MGQFGITGRAISAALVTLFLIGCTTHPGAVRLDQPKTADAGATASQSTAADPNNGPARDRDKLRVMSFNLRTSTVFDLHNTWGLRKALLVKSIQTYRPDLLGTQECQWQQARYLRRHLPGYGFVGAGRSDGQKAGEMVALFYRKDRFRCEQRGHFWLSDEPGQPGSETWDGLLPRMVSWARLTRRATGQTLYLFNTHFSAFGAGARRKSARLLSRRVNQIAGRAPVIVTGDFNAGEHSKPYNIMVSRSDQAGAIASTTPRLVDTFRDVFPKRQANLGTLHGFDGHADSNRIDWILASPRFNPVSASIKRYHDDGRYPSDHFPVTAVLHWSGSTAKAGEEARDRS